MTAREFVIQARGLVKSFGSRRVLDAVDFQVRAGELFGYLGPNGSGKSSTVHILAGLDRSFQGEVSVCGMDPRTESVELKRHIGYIPESAHLYSALTLREQLEMVGGLHQVPQARLRMRIQGLADAFELSSRLDTQLGGFSKGMKQKALLCGALLHNPKLLFLDEPLSGLDVSSTMMFKELMAAFMKDGRTMFYCSHNMDVVERVCSRIAIISAGKILATGTFDELSSQSGGVNLESLFTTLTRGDDGKRRAAQALEAIGD